jgi:hypothetical protein
MTKPTSFQSDIRPLFTERDIRGMSKAFNLGSYDDVKTHAAAIYDRIRGIGGAVMPPSTANANGCSRMIGGLPLVGKAGAGPALLFCVAQPPPGVPAKIGQPPNPRQGERDLRLSRAVGRRFHARILDTPVEQHRLTVWAAQVGVVRIVHADDVDQPALRVPAM